VSSSWHIGSVSFDAILRYLPVSTAIQLAGQTKVKLPNYYELLQISPNADPETIHRIFQFMAARLHPDNPTTGDAEKFMLVKEAYDALSDPSLRAQYDAAREMHAPQPAPLSTAVDFMDTVEGELNRRLGLLALLYNQRRTDPDRPQLSLHEVEKLMGFPRDYLEFSIWYVHKKGYITRSDNSAFTLTADGVDFVETQRGRMPVLNKMLTSGSEPSPTDRRSSDPGNVSSAAHIPVNGDRRVGGDRRRRG
jgi:curved DNA-binding protein CbpA